MMGAFFYGVALQWKLDIRSKTLLITCYAVPLLFFFLMGEIFTSIDPQARETLIPSMTVMGVSMGALIGLPPSLAELYGGEIRKMYRANGIPLYLGLAATFLSAFLHLLIMSGILYAAAPLVFGAMLPTHPPAYFSALTLFIAVSLSLGCTLGLAVQNQARLTMLSQLVFLPSIMLSGILFPSALLPRFLAALGQLFPAAWGFRALLNGGALPGNLWPQAAVLAAAAVACGLLLRRLRFD